MIINPGDQSVTQTHPDLGNIYVQEVLAPVGTECMYIVNDVIMHEGAQLKSKLQQVGN